MKQTLQLRVTQQLALTPQLQQSIRLLQMSTLELDHELERLLADNPLIERLDDPMHAELRIAPNGGLDSDRSAGPEAAPSQAGAGADSGPDGDAPAAADEGGYTDPTEDYAWGGDTQRAGPGDEEERDYPQLASADVSLREHLLAQLADTACTVRDRGLVQVLVDELDDHGYLQASLDEILEMIPAELGIERAELNTALKLLQSFEPTGVGARDIPECLLLQLAAIESGATDAPCQARVLELARAIVTEHLGLLANRDYTRLKRLLRCSDAAVREAHALIRRLDPRPGKQFASEQAPYVVPDVLVRRTRSGWTVELNPDVVPRLRVNDAYARILRGNRGSNGALGSQLQEARWLVKNVQQRFDTILRVSRAVVERQKAFFVHGAVAMRPLVLREIAEALQLHESTISRVTTQKYMLTPYGTFELKYFFGSHVATEAGGAASSTAVRALIRQILAEENPKKPLSDSSIAAILGEQGFVVARRTVAKYREALRIPPVSLRRAI
ncbi:MAG: RNA polymerase factor sigma-54 [Burkholderiales bacterium]|nr:MAG: RNA polymerase factor sigma-54 [Burkholderiales bacterium]